MSLDGHKCDDSPKKSESPCFEPSDCPSMALVITPLASYLHSIYDEQDWDVDDLL
jgi:hypothetical protein